MKTLHVDGKMLLYSFPASRVGTLELDFFVLLNNLFISSSLYLSVKRVLIVSTEPFNVRIRHVLCFQPSNVDFLSSCIRFIFPEGRAR